MQDGQNSTVEMQPALMTEAQAKMQFLTSIVGAWRKYAALYQPEELLENAALLEDLKLSKHDAETFHAQISDVMLEIINYVMNEPSANVAEIVRNYSTRYPVTPQERAIFNITNDAVTELRQHVKAVKKAARSQSMPEIDPT